MPAGLIDTVFGHQKTRRGECFGFKLATMNRTQVVLVGAGPIGIELAVALKHAGVDYLHLEAGQIGQTVSWYPKQSRFFSSPERISIAGVPLITADQTKATREEYLAYLRGVVQTYGLQTKSYQRVVAMEQDTSAGGGGFLVHTRKGGNVSELIHCQKIILAIGDMHKPRQLHVPGEDLGHVSHYFEEPHPYFDQDLLIVGGRNSAVEAALRCHRAGARVTMSYRRAGFDEEAIKYWLLPEIKALINAGEIRFLPQTVPARILAGKVVLKPVDGHEPPAVLEGQAPIEADADFVLLLTGYLQDQSLFDQLSLQRRGPNQAPVLDPGTQEASVPGVYVAGTATAGTQNTFSVFIENAHPHVERIVKAITGTPPPAGLINQAAKTYGLPES